MAFADWLQMIPMWDWHDLAMRGWPEWERGDDGKEPWRVDLAIVNGQDRSSRERAIEIDDVATGPFYYRDFTDDTIPFVRDGETYRSSFWFARKADRDEFQRRMATK